MTTKPNLDTYSDRLKAVLCGERIIDDRTTEPGYFFKWDFNRHQLCNSQGATIPADWLDCVGNWKYYTEPKQKPTMAECLKAKKVRIKCDSPHLCASYRNGYTYKKNTGWGLYDVRLFREAITDPDGLGWEIEIVEE